MSYPSGQPVVEYQYYLGYSLNDLFADDKVDFQVQAMIGSIHRTFNPNATNQLEMYPYVFTGETSGWSNTQTLTIPETSTLTSSSPNPTPTPAVPEFSWLMILLIFIFTLSVANIVRLGKTGSS